MEGDGIVLELHGYVIDVLAPGDSAMTDGAVAGGVAPAGAPIPVRARVRMLCSCPTQPGGLWEVREVRARLARDGRRVAEIPLTYAGEASTYAGTLPLAATGEYLLEVLAASPETATFGRVVRTLRLSDTGRRAR